jgi:hypothetical protein
MSEKLPGCVMILPSPTGQVVAVLRQCWLLHRVVVIDQIGIPLVHLI